MVVFHQEFPNSRRQAAKSTDLLESCRIMVEFLEMGLSRQRRSQPAALYWTGAVPWLWFRMNVWPRDPLRSRLSSAAGEKT